MKRTFLVFGLVVAAMGWTFGASAGQEEDATPVTRLTVHPAAAPRPALKYKLLPGFFEKRPGNAAVVYNRLWAENYQLYKYYAENGPEIASWADMPLEKLPREKVKNFVAMTGGVYRDFVWGSRLESCDWEQPFREGNPFAVLLPEIQQIRTPARFFAIRARWQIAQGRFDEAIETLRTGYALGRNVAESPCLVADLVGMAICGIMSHQIETMIEQPGCPNLYWALTDLPSPIIDTRGAFEAEYDMFYLAFPELRKIDETNHGPEYWRNLVERMADQLTWLNNPRRIPKDERAVFAGLVLKGYPKARRALIAQGRTADEVDAMPVAQVVMIYTVETFEELRDEQFKWLYLPWWQAAPGMKEANRSLREESQRREIIPVAGMLLPAIQAVKFAEARNERTIALLRTIEALRLHAASHDGRLPERLTDIAEVPIPIDPLTGRPIECKIADGVATLEVFDSPRSKKPDRLIEIRMAK
ncbi:MAG: hypothetical protein JW888_18885 [Pirellulales bacterium]|nr:hypothetical protein [Pirellulales bacterium]